MSDHLLHIDSVEQGGYVYWSFTCEHPDTDERWAMRNPDGTFWSIDNPMADGCWLMSWWSGLYSELIDDMPGPIVSPIPVRPSDHWDYEEGGTIVKDVTA